MLLFYVIRNAEIEERFPTVPVIVKNFPFSAWNCPIVSCLELVRVMASEVAKLNLALKKSKFLGSGEVVLSEMGTPSPPFRNMTVLMPFEAFIVLHSPSMLSPLIKLKECRITQVCTNGTGLYLWAKLVGKAWLQLFEKAGLHRQLSAIEPYM